MHDTQRYQSDWMLEYLARNVFPQIVHAVEKNGGYKRSGRRRRQVIWWYEYRPEIDTLKQDQNTL